MSAKHAETIKKHQLAGVRKVLYPLSPSLHVSTFYQTPSPSLRTSFVDGTLTEIEGTEVCLNLPLPQKVEERVNMHMELAV